MLCIKTVRMDRDPRVYFAAERTLLAWVRTGVTVIGLGFVVARFGLFVRLVATNRPEMADEEVGLSSYLGAALVLLGAAFTGAAALQFKRLLRELSPEELPRTSATGNLALIVALLIAAGGTLLGVVLVRTR